MTVADLALWFARPHPTLRSWVKWGTKPRGPRLQKILAELDTLEKLIKKRKGFPIPYEIGHYQRPSYLKKIRNGRDAHLPRLDPAR